MPVAPTAAPAALGKRGREDDKADDEKSEEESGDESDEKEQDKDAPQEEHIVEEAVTRTERSAKPQVTIRGHTSYLTFARRIREAK